MAGIEPATSSLPRTRSTPELHERGIFYSSRHVDNSPRGNRFSVPQKEMTNAAKSGAEPTKARYPVKKKVKRKEFREIPIFQGVPGLLIAAGSPTASLFRSPGPFSPEY